MAMIRGGVYRMRVQVTQRGGTEPEWLDKYIVVLQDPASMDAGATNFAFVICSTDRTAGRGPRAFEVLLGREDGFEGSTILDGRWVYTYPRSEVAESEYQ